MRSCGISQKGESASVVSYSLKSRPDRAYWSRRVMLAKDIVVTPSSVMEVSTYLQCKTLNRAKDMFGSDMDRGATRGSARRRHCTCSCSRSRRRYSYASHQYQFTARHSEEGLPHGRIAPSGNSRGESCYQSCG
jgi:hypothetical protein